MDALLPFSVTIRAATADDADELAALHIRVWQWAYRGQLPDVFLDSLSGGLERRRVWYASHLAALPIEDRWWLAVLDGQIIGFVSTLPSRDEDVPPMTGEVAAVYLDQPWAGRGLGHAIFAHAVDDLRQRGYTRATLWVLDSNARARRFYEREGWQPDGARKTDGRFGIEIVEVRYQRALEAGAQRDGQADQE